MLAGEVLHFAPDSAGHPARVLTEVDGPAFAEAWISAVEAAQR